MPKTSIYLSDDDYNFLLRLAATLTIKKNKKYSLSHLIKLIIELIRMVHEDGIPDDLGYYLQNKNPEILDLFLAKPQE